MALSFIVTPTSVIRVKGSDAQSFLHGQCTADLNKNLPQNALWLNRKGRVLAHTLISKEADGSFLVLCPHLSPAEIISIISANLIADDVELLDETPLWLTGVLWGDETPRAQEGIQLWPSSRGGLKLWEVLAQPQTKISFQQGSWVDLEKNRIESAVPNVPLDCGINEFPQECGLDDWVSDQKGCYLGQEVMARIQSMGSLRRILRQVKAKRELSAGLELKSPLTGKVVGVLKSFSGSVGLALVAIDLKEGEVVDSIIGPIKCGRPAVLPKS